MYFDMKTFKTIFLLAMVFLAGIVVGAVVTRAVVRHVVREAVLHPEKVQTLMERNLTRRLRLDTGQEATLHQILSDAHTQLKELRQQYRPQIAGVFSNANGRINAMLTPEQQARFEKLKSENRPLMEALQQSR
jgi:Spy/CpxP family protein refolding chaperone